ncbi:MAG TPA: hypothetical protein GXX25_14580 [Desulfotomaculum sp.]|nr:hypothetical protein [Desulfotomaculum sp.]
MNTVSPVFAAEWDKVSNHQPPAAYAANGINTYSRGQYEDFFINYNGDQLGTDGAVFVGSLYPVDVFDKYVGAHESFGYAAVSQNNLNSPYYASDKAKIEDFLQGFQVPYDTGTGYYLVSMDFIDQQSYPVQVGNQTYWVRGAWPLSSAIRDLPLDVTVQDIPGEQVRAWNYSPDLGQEEIDCAKNDGSGFEGQSYYVKEMGSGSTPSLWQKARVFVGDPKGPTNLTQKEAAALMANNIGRGAGDGQSTAPGYPTQWYPEKTWRGQCGVSFPYNIFVTGVQKISDNGDSADYDWSVVNQTPLWLNNITVRVYTRGKTTGTWNLVQIYQNIDIPPAKRGGGLLRDPQSKDVIVTAAGMWSIAQPKVYAHVPKPSEDYDVIVTANVNLNIQGGHLSFPSAVIDYGMRGAYAAGRAGNAPPGLPPGETKEMWDRASSILGKSLPQGYNDNIDRASDTGAPPPGGGGGGGGGGEPPVLPGNLAVTRVEYDGSRITGYFRSTFPVGGKVNIRFYKQDKNGNISYVAGVMDRLIEPNGDFVESIPAFNLTNYIIIASIDYSYSGGTWQKEQYRRNDGTSQEETTYEDNKALTGKDEEPPKPPEKSFTIDKATGYYWPVKWEKTPRYRTEKRRVWQDDWQEVPVNFAPEPKIRVRLRPDGDNWEQLPDGRWVQR